jgi:hypothetical protein
LWEPVSFAYKKHRNSLEYLATNHAGFSKFNAHNEQRGFEQLNLYFSTRLALQKRDTDKENKTAKRQNTRNKTDVIGGNIIQLGSARINNAICDVKKQQAKQSFLAGQRH